VSVIELDSVARRYETGAGTVTALEDIDLTVDAGELVVVLGPSGSGKTTLLNLVGALDTATEGRVVVAGHDVTAASRGQLFRYRRETVSFVFQSFNLFPGLTALENVRFGADVAGRPDAIELARHTLEQVGLGDRTDHFLPLSARATAGRHRWAWPPGTRCCWPTNPPASSTSAPECPSSNCFASRPQQGRPC
jgi:putative ABC transport system ATP-binding protein